MNPNQQKLRELAEKMSQPGPWYVRRALDVHPTEHTIVDVNLMWIADLGASPKSDADYIAAVDPQTVIALLDECDRLRESVECLEAARVDVVQQLAAMTAARDEACDRLDSWVTALAARDRPAGEADIARIRKVGGSK